MDSKLARMFQPMRPTERRAVGVIALIAMCRMFGLFALLPVLALYAAGLEGATPTLIGLAVGGYGLTQAVLQMPFGLASDRFGRVPVIVFGLLLFASGSLLAAESTTIAGVVAGRFLQGAGAISATLSALLADATRDEMRTRSMAMLGIGIGLSFVLALVGGPLLASAYGARTLFYIAAGLAVVAGLLLVLLPRGIERPMTRRRMPLSAAIRPDLVRLDVYVFLLHALLTASFVALPFLLQGRLGLPLVSHWKVYVAAMAASLLATVPLIVADERQSKGATFALAVLLVLGGQAMLAFTATDVFSAFVALALFFGGFNFLEAALPARLSIRAVGTLRGASLGIFSSAQFLGAFAGGLLGGWLLAGGNPGAVFLVCALLALTWLALLNVGPGRD